MLDSYLADRRAESGTIAAERRALLDAVATDLRGRRAAGSAVDLTFICTHNSRRSHLGQIWAQIAAHHFGLAGVTTWSGGTEATAFYPSAVESLRRAGLKVDASGDPTNPKYEVTSHDDCRTMSCWSKVFSDAANPQAGFVAIMTCGSADEACPSVPGAAARFAVTYEDPKAFDGSDREAEAYDERCAQICREMLYLFERVAADLH